MQTATLTAPKAHAGFWIGHVLSTLAILFLLMDGTVHLTKIAPVVDAFNQLGYPMSAALPMGVIELTCLALYVFPRTSVLGAILLTGYLGGAVAIHLRVGSPLFSHLLFPIYVGAMIWGGLYLRDARLRALVPLRG
jgi:hypothetical protein